MSRARSSKAVTLQIGPAQQRDLAHLSRIELAAAALFPPGRLPEPDQVLPAAELRAACQAGWLWVARHGAEPMGFALCAPEGSDLYLVELSVHPKTGRQGIGRALLRSVLEAAVAQGFTGVTLTTFGDLPWNAPFYESEGFTVVARQDEEAVGPECPAHLREHLSQEAAGGLQQRVAMRRALTAP
ncbi:MAG: GNAT family N-acetyltransferase [Pseudomonadota bacterium]